MTEKPTLEEITAYVGGLAELIPFFPRSAEAHVLIAAEIRSFVGNREQWKWFRTEAARKISKWEGMPYLRALYATRFTPDDGVAPVVWFPGYTPDECEARYKQIEMEESTRKLEQYRRAALEAPAEDREPLLLPAPAEILKPIEKAVPIQKDLEASLKAREEKLAQRKGPERSLEDRRRLEIELMEQLHGFNSEGHERIQ